MAGVTSSHAQDVEMVGGTAQMIYLRSQTVEAKSPTFGASPVPFKRIRAEWCAGGEKRSHLATAIQPWVCGLCLAIRDRQKCGFRRPGSRFEAFCCGCEGD